MHNDNLLPSANIILRFTSYTNWVIFFSGDNGKIAYAITSGDEKGDFNIASNGTIATKRSLDRETQSIYNLVVTATDQAIAPEKRLSSTVQVSTTFIIIVD